MTFIIKHRVNNLNNLKNTPKKFGVEIDVRSYKNKLILNHEPFLNGENFDEYLNQFDHRFLIINVKEEGIEKRIFQLIKYFKIKNYFFLDSTIPFSLKMNKIKNKSLRISDIENVNFNSSKIKSFNWVWVDYLNERYSLKKKELSILKKLKIKLCLVSPELVNNKFHPKILFDFIKIYNFVPDAICTKKTNYWDKIFNNS